MYKIKFLTTVTSDESGEIKKNYHTAKYGCDNQLRSIARNWLSLGFKAIVDVEVVKDEFTKLTKEQAIDLLYTEKMVTENSKMLVAKENLLRTEKVAEKKESIEEPAEEKPLNKMNKTELIAYAKSKGYDLDERLNRNNFFSTIIEHESNL
jgi:hypothetical protein